MTSIIVLALFKKRVPHFPAAILVVIGGTLLVYLLGLQKPRAQTVRTVPRGLSSSSAPGFKFSSIRMLLPTSMVILFVGYMESIAVAKLIAAKEKYRIDPNQELKGLGLANIVGAFFLSRKGN